MPGRHALALVAFVASGCQAYDHDAYRRLLDAPAHDASDALDALDALDAPDALDAAPGPDAADVVVVDRAPIDASDASDSGVRVLYHSDFTTGSDTGWTPLAGAWTSTGADGSAPAFCAAPPDPTTLSIAVAGNLAWTDYTVTAELLPVVGQGIAGLLARAQSASAYYNFQLANDASGWHWTLWVNTTASFSMLAMGDVAVDASTRVQLRLVMHGSVIVAAISTDAGASFGTVATVVDATFAMGEVGLKAGDGVCFTRVDVTAP